MVELVNAILKCVTSNTRFYLKSNKQNSLEKLLYGFKFFNERFLKKIQSPFL